MKKLNSNLTILRFIIFCVKDNIAARRECKHFSDLETDTLSLYKALFALTTTSSDNIKPQNLSCFTVIFIFSHKRYKLTISENVIGRDLGILFIFIFFLLQNTWHWKVPHDNLYWSSFCCDVPGRSQSRVLCGVPDFGSLCSFVGFDSSFLSHNWTIFPSICMTQSSELKWKKIKMSQCMSPYLLVQCLAT